MPLAAHTLMLAALVLGEGEGEGEVAIRLSNPAIAPASAPASSTAIAQTPPPSEPPVPYAADAVPMPPRPLGPQPQARKLGTNTTIFVNFDGVTIDYCSPSNSHEDCSWLETDRTFDPFSASVAHRVAILDAMRAQINPYGVRVTGQRPPDDEPYTMVVYGGEAEDDEALGRAPAGDCWDDLPNQIAYVYLDGERSSWINGGASTALHEAAHTWGFDHIGLEGSLMAPAGGNTITKFFDGCAQIVSDVELTPVEDEGSCPQISLEQCGLGDFQHDIAMLHLLFGQPYVDDVAPTLELVRPFDGVYYQAPATFHATVRIIDDQHPQIYEVAVGIEGLVDDPPFRPAHDPSFDIELLPVGEWRLQLRVRDEAGNQSSLEFWVIVGEDPVRLDDGCTCSEPGDPGPLPAALGLLGLLALRPRRRPAPGESPAAPPR